MEQRKKMDRGNFSFDWLLHPITPVDFFQSYWEKSPLLIQGRGESYFRDLFTLKEMDRLLLQGRFSPDELKQLGLKSTDEPLVKANGRANVDAVYKAFSRGSTILLNFADVRHPGINALANGLASHTGFVSLAGLFLTPEGCQGLNQHFDIQDVFILQLNGSKHWQVYPPATQLPTSSDHAFAVSEESLPEPVMDVVLHPGDLLFMPRGFIHNPYTSNSHSLHLTLGVYASTWADVMKAGLNRALLKYPAMRRSLPPGYMGECKEKLKKEFDTFFEEFTQHMDLDYALHSISRENRVARPSPGEGLFQSIAQLNRLNLETKVGHRPGTCPMVCRDGGQALIYFAGNQMMAPLKVEAALKFVAGRSQFRVAELEGGLSDNAKLVLTRNLIKNGLLSILSLNAPEEGLES